MIWCDNRKKDDYRISLLGFWLYFPYALPYYQLLIETFLYVCEIGCCKKNVLSFIWIHFQTIISVPIFHCLWACLCMHMHVNCSILLGVPLNKSWTSSDKMVLLVLIPGNEFIFIMSWIKKLKRIGPISIDLWYTPNGEEHGLNKILSIFTECVL